MTNEQTIFRTLDNPRILEVPIFEEACPHRKAHNLESELNDPQLIVTVKGGVIDLVRNLDDYPFQQAQRENGAGDLALSDPPLRVTVRDGVVSRY